ncbi:MAG TPA: maleylpyruvate isomerase family mycothiol-dependent enzyme [Pseudonocardiaceae bacterium]|jgi:uncharacterized protein (TIGR03083 family)|nr:maleylpyruvate isomerase family mycothiol-dependent enzyme [Pseudonocardiaceae bacterium]
MSIENWLTSLRDEGALLAEVAGSTAPTARVPTCPDWALRDLLLHVGGVHRWATTIVREARAEPIALVNSHDIVAELPTDDELVDWFRAGHAALVDALAAAPADLACWTFMRTGSDSAAFWARRQAHETTIHRMDAEAAVGRYTPVAPDLAADGIDELLTGFVPRNRKLRGETERTLLVSATDLGRHWFVRLGPDRPRISASDQPTAADTTISGPAAVLYPVLWNRRPWDGLTVTGDAELAARWSDAVRVTWS